MKKTLMLSMAGILALSLLFQRCETGLGSPFFKPLLIVRDADYQFYVENIAAAYECLLPTMVNVPTEILDSLYTNFLTACSNEDTAAARILVDTINSYSTFDIRPCILGLTNNMEDLIDDFPILSLYNEEQRDSLISLTYSEGVLSEDFPNVPYEQLKSSTGMTAEGDTTLVQCNRNCRRGKVKGSIISSGITVGLFAATGVAAIFTGGASLTMLGGITAIGSLFLGADAVEDKYKLCKLECAIKYMDE